MVAPTSFLLAAAAALMTTGVSVISASPMFLEAAQAFISDAPSPSAASSSSSAAATASASSGIGGNANNGSGPRGNGTNPYISNGMVVGASTHGIALHIWHVGAGAGADPVFSSPPSRPCCLRTCLLSPSTPAARLHAVHIPWRGRNHDRRWHTAITGWPRKVVRGQRVQRDILHQRSVDIEHRNPGGPTAGGSPL